MKRNAVRWVRAGAAVVLVAVLIAIGWHRHENAKAQVIEAGRATSRTTPASTSETSFPSDRQASERTEPEEPRGGIDLSNLDVKRAFTIHDEAREFLKNAELKRAELFCQYQDADGNSSSTLLLKRPVAEELSRIYEEYVGSLSGQDREFVEKTGLDSNLRREIESFFDYEKQYRYVGFLLAGDGSASLPSVMVLESDKLYDRQIASKGELNIPMEEANLTDWGDLKTGDPKLDRYGRLFSIKKDD